MEPANGPSAKTLAVSIRQIYNLAIMSDIQHVNIRRFDVGTLMLIQSILSERSVTVAARVSGISQPAASNALSRLRKAFGDPLMVRGAEGMTLTVRGETLLDQLGEIVPRIEAMTRPASFEPSRATDMLSLAASDHASLLLVPALTERVSRMAPNIRLAVSLVQSGGAGVTALEKAGVNLRLGWLQSLPQSWYIRRLMDDEIGVICRRDAPVDAKSIDKDFFLNAGHVALSTDRPYYQTLADQALARQGLSRRVAVWTTNFTAIPLIVARSDMIAFFPASIARMYEGFADIKVLPSPVEVGDYNLSMAWHPRIHTDPAYRWLRSRIVETASGLGTDRP